MVNKQPNGLSPSKLLLLINSCGQNDKICLVGPRRRVCQPLQAIRSAESIITTLDRLLASHRLELATVGGIVVVSGPGNFTTTKIGIAIANACAWSANLPIIGVKPSETERSYTYLTSKIAKTGSRIIKPHLPPPNITWRLGQFTSFTHYDTLIEHGTTARKINQRNSSH